MAPNRVFFTDFSGGWAPSRSPTSIAPNELRDLNNYCIGPKGELMTRPPLLRSSSDAHPDEIWHLNINNGEQITDPWGLLVGNDGSGASYFGFDSSSTLITLTDLLANPSLDPAPNTKSVIYKDIFYVFSDGIAGAFGPVAVPIRVDILDDLTFDHPGITAPGAPTVTPLAGGSLPAAVYQCVVTFFNPRTGTESTIGTSASVTTAAGNLQIAWSGIPTASTSTSGQAQVQYRRLWRTLPNQVNEYYLVGTLVDNTTTVFTDNVAVASMGSRASIDRFEGEFSITWTGGFALWRERLWSTTFLSNSLIGTTQDSIIYSRIGLVENYNGDALLPVGMNDNSPLISLEAADDYLLAFKALNVYRITGTGPSNFRVDRLRSPTGIWDTYAVASGPPGTFFLGSDGYFYFTAGNQVQNISERLGKLDLHAGVNPPQIQSIVWPGKNWFMTVVYQEADVDCFGSVTGIIGDGSGEAAGAVGSFGWATVCDSEGTGQQVQADVNGVFIIENVPCGDYSLILADDAATAYREEAGPFTVEDGIETDVGTFQLDTLGPAPECTGTPTGDPASATATIYVYDYVKNAWMYWSFLTGTTRPKPRCLSVGYNADTRGPRLYVGGQTDANAFVNYFDDDLFNSTANTTDVLSVVGETITDTDSSPARSIRTKDFDAKDFGFPAGSAFIVRQVLMRVAWPVSITDQDTPDGNWDLEFEFNLWGDTNTGVVNPELLATNTAVWSTEDRANEQWHALGLSSQENATTSIGLEIISEEGLAPRRHSITGIAFDVVPVNRDFVQPNTMLVSNITGSISGVVTGGAGGTAYLCPEDTTVPNDSMVMDGSGNYSFTGLPPGDYLLIVTDSGNTASAVDSVTLTLGEALVHNFASLDIPEPAVGCPIA